MALTTAASTKERWINDSSAPAPKHKLEQPWKAYWPPTKPETTVHMYVDSGGQGASVRGVDGLRNIDGAMVIRLDDERMLQGSE